MNDLDALSRRLDELGRRAPVPEADPLLDVRRGRVALLRRRRARNVTAITTTVLAVGAAVVAAPLLIGPVGPTGGETASLRPAGSPSAASDQSAQALCSLARLGGLASGSGRQVWPTAESVQSDRIVPSETSESEPWKDPAVAPVLAAYRQAAVQHLDPVGKHLDLDGEVTNVQTGCDEDGLVSLGTKLGWESGDALGVVQVEVVSPARRGDTASTSERLVEPPQIVMGHSRWTAYDGALPAGVRKARVADDADGHAVVVKRDDGLTVAVDAAGVWGNNAAPGSPSAGDLPSVEQLLALAASPLLVLP